MPDLYRFIELEAKGGLGMKFLDKAINSLTMVISIALCGISVYFFTVNNLADAIYLLVFATLITIAGMWADLHGEEK